MLTLILSSLLLVVLLFAIVLYRRQVELSNEIGIHKAERLRLEIQAENFDNERRQLLSAGEAKEVELTRLRSKLQESISQEAELNIRLKFLGEALEEARQSKQELSGELQSQFRLLANEVLGERSKNLEERSRELLSPLRDDIKRFAEKVEHTYGQEAKERYSLQEQIKELVARSLQLGQEADQLSRALRGESKVQGNWGEMVLEKILERSGLERGKEYEVQEVVHDASGTRFIPDVIVHYPGGGSIVIDSKVSLTAYTQYVNAESDEERKRYASLHVQSVKKHIEELGRKSYEEIVKDSAGFVMMFIPNEPAYTLAISEYPTLWEEAYRQHIILMNGTNLIAALRMALDLWKRERQINNVEHIVTEASRMYDSFVRFSERFVEAERQMEKALSTLTDAKRTLTTGRGNLAGRFDKLSKLGLRIKRQIPESLLLSSDEDEEEDSDSEA